MKKVFTNLVLAILFYATPCFADIIQTNDINVIAEMVEKAEKDTLVIFDVDDVLLEPNDQILKFQNKPYLEDLEKKLEKRISEEKAHIFYSRIFVQRVNHPVNAGMICLIDQLQKRGIKVIALTNCPTGPFGEIPSMQDWRVGELTRLGYHFDKSWDGTKPKSFTEISSKDPKRPSAFNNGVIFASGASKGEALKAFLDYAHYMPKRMIFIDDKKKHLQSVENLADNLGIDFTGIEYTAVKDKKLEPLNKKRAEFQLQFLEKEGIWLSDIQANEMLKKKHDHGH